MDENEARLLHATVMQVYSEYQKAMLEMIELEGLCRTVRSEPDRSWVIHTSEDIIKYEAEETKLREEYESLTKRRDIAQRNFRTWQAKLASVLPWYYVKFEVPGGFIWKEYGDRGMRFISFEKYIEEKGGG